MYTDTPPVSQAAQHPTGPAAVRHDSELSERRQGEGTLQGQIRSAQQPAGLPGREARLDSRGSVRGNISLQSYTVDPRGIRTSPQTSCLGHTLSPGGHVL